MPVTQRHRVLLLIPHLGGGGAERVTALLARELSQEKYELHLAAVTQTHEQVGVSLLGAHNARAQISSVQVHALGARRVRGGALRVLRLVRRLRPDAVLCGMAHLNFLVLLLRPLFPRNTRILVRQNSTASAALEFGGLPGYTRLLYRLLYRRADRVICQAEAMAADLVSTFGVAPNRIAVLPNPIDTEAIGARTGKALADWPESSAAGPHLLAVGRLSREKGFDLLIEAMAQVRSIYPNADLLIAGSGPEEAALRKLCADLNLEMGVRFAGHVDDPARYFAGATLFVLSSRHEGLPNALLEAAAGGLPIAALPSSQGVADLLRGQGGVWLAEDVSADSLARILLTALGELRPGERFTHRFVEPFRLENAIAEYEALIEQVLSEARG
jgi:glycosyltransferase involved in cell wall biosynthesis